MGCDRSAHGDITQQASTIAQAHGVDVIQTKISIAALMAAANEPGVGFAADGAGGYILPGFLPAFDAAGALLKMLDLLARHDRSLAEAEGMAEWDKQFVARPSAPMPRASMAKKAAAAASKEPVTLETARAAARRLRNPRDWEKGDS